MWHIGQKYNLINFDESNYLLVENDFFNHNGQYDLILEQIKTYVGITTKSDEVVPVEKTEEQIIDEINEETDTIVTTTVTVNGEVVTENKTGSKKGLSVNKDGIIVKTN